MVSRGKAVLVGRIKPKDVSLKSDAELSETILEINNLRDFLGNFLLSF
jgi:hypothetical protein